MKKRTVIVLLAGMLALSTTSCGNSNNKPIQNTVQENTVTNTQEDLPPIEPDQNIVLDIDDTEMNENFSDQTIADESERGNDFDKKVYEYINNLLKSDKNPSNFTEIPGIPINENPSDEKYADALREWNKSCEKYEKNVNKKAAKKFGITADEALEIYVKYTATAIGSEPTESMSENDKTFVEKFATEIVVSSKMLLERFVNNYDIPLATQLWTLADFDENGAVMAMADIVEKTSGLAEKAVIVLTPNIEDDKMVGSTPHYVSVGSTIYGNDGYCDEFLANLEEILSSQ